MFGASANQIDGDGMAGFDLPGFQLFAFTSLPSGQKGHWQMELGYITKGSKEPVSDTSFQYKCILHVIELNILYRYDLGPIEVEVGVGPDFIALAKEETIYGEFEGPAFNAVAANAIAGIRYNLNNRWALGFRSHYSFTPIRSGRYLTGRPGLLDLGGGGQRSASLSFGIYYTFNRR